MKKRMLEKYTSRYDKVPSWLMIMLSCFIALGYFLISGFLSGDCCGNSNGYCSFVLSIKWQHSVPGYTFDLL